MEKSFWRSKTKIRIARALYNDPQLIILDEATSSLDIETEDILLMRFLVTARKTIIFISHKQRSLIKCDRILT